MKYMSQLKFNFIIALLLIFLSSSAFAQRVVVLSQSELISTEICDCGLVKGKWKPGKIKDSTKFIPFSNTLKKTKKALKRANDSKRQSLKAKLTKQKRKNSRFKKSCAQAIKAQGVPTPVVSTPFPEPTPPVFVPTPVPTPPSVTPTPTNNNQPIQSPNEPWSIAYKGYNFRILSTQNFDQETIVYAEISNQGTLTESRSFYNSKAFITDGQGNRFTAQSIIKGSRRSSFYSDFILPPNTPTRIGFVFENITNSSNLLYFTFEADDIKAEFNNLAVPVDRPISVTQSGVSTTSKSDSDFSTRVLKYTNYDTETIVEVEVINLTPSKIERTIYASRVEINDEKGNRLSAESIILGTTRSSFNEIILPPNSPVRISFVFPNTVNSANIPYLGFTLQGTPEDISSFYNIPFVLNESIADTTSLGVIDSNSKTGFNFKVVEVFNTDTETTAYVEIINTGVNTNKTIYSSLAIITDQLGNRFSANNLIVGTRRSSFYDLELPQNSPVRIGFVFPNISNSSKLIYFGFSIRGAPEISVDFVNVPLS
jgi:hypothetical protein